MTDGHTYCGARVRGARGATCELRPFHSGHHSTVVFHCDGCSGVFRGYPTTTARDGEYEHGLAFCYLCAKGLR